MNKPAQGDYAWANYLIYMEGGAELPWPVEEPRKHPLWHGVLFVAALAAAAYAVTAFGAKGIEPVTVALPLGLLIGNLLKLPESWKSGIRYTVKSILTLGIILLGVRLNFGDVLKVGASAMLMSAAQVVLMLALAMLIQRASGIGAKQATLLGIGTAICGGSAIIATAPVIDAEERDIAFAVATVSFLGLGTMFLLPLVAKALGMDDKAFGVWAGLSIHQTPQVVAAGFAYSNEAGQAATLVKLARVCLLAPLVLALGFVYRKRADGKKHKRYGLYDFLPPMVLGLLALAIVHSLGLVPQLNLQFPQGSLAGSGFGLDLLGIGKTASGIAIAMGMAAVGLETSFRSLRNIGLRPFLAGLVMAVAGILFSFFAIRLFGV
ncbi:MAG: putative sulfate exporter family transporter [Acidobacteria bacterium]|nr:putative sulfate exporter family transporter [Acidobacteriota bacterium]